MPRDDGVTGTIRELVSTLGRMDEEEGKEEVEVSCADFRSTFFAEDSMQITTCYNLEVMMPYELERPHDLRRATSPCWRPTSNLG